MAKRRSTAQLARDRRRIANLYLKGVLQVDIAAELGIHQGTVSRDLKVIQKAWQESTLVDFNAARAREFAKVDRLEREYWAAWDRSCEDAEVRTQKEKEGRRGAKDVERILQRKGQAGDPRFLGGVQWCIDRRCKLLGLDEPSHLVVDWRQEAEEAGLDPSEVFEQMVAAAAAALEAGD